MKKLFFFLTTAVMIVLVSVVVGCTHCSENKFNLAPNLSVEEHNRQCYEACQEDLLVITCLVEGFHSEPYYCGAKWTQGYGSTVHRNGKRVTKRDATISLADAKKDVYSHYEKHVWPWIDRCVSRKLTKEQMIGTCSFIYNIGGEAFSTSNFLSCLNSGKNDAETAFRMNGFRRSAGKFAPGLPKRHWIEGALFQGLLTIENLLDLKPEKFYDQDNSFYYKDRRGPYWTHDYSKEKIEEFLRKNHSDTNNVRAYI